MNPAQAANVLGNMAPDFPTFFLYALIAAIAGLAVFCATLIWGIKRVVWWALKHSQLMFDAACKTQDSAARSIQDCTRAMTDVCNTLKDVKRSVNGQDKTLIAFMEHNASEHTEHARILRATVGALQEAVAEIRGARGHESRGGTKRKGG